MSNRNTNTKRIAKNTVVLYIRMAVTMFITLFTSRFVLKALGFEDYGLYNVVAGVVTLFAFLKSSMSSSTQRFLSYEMGNGDSSNLQKVFSICLTAHFIIAIALLLLAETIGLWFLNSQISIPEGREQAANWIYQFSVVSLCISVISIPYLADVISNERMGYFAFLGILDAVLKLLIAFAIMHSDLDRLILYGFLRMMITVVNYVLNWSFCYKNCPESHFMLYWDKGMFKQVFSFSGWTIFGQMAIVGSNQGTNILVNIFKSVVANAAMGVGQQVNSTLNGLVGNFQTAFKPQITKSYAAKDYDYLNYLSNYAAKISFFLLFLVSFPIILNINPILHLWLEDVPLFSDKLCIIFIVASLCNAVSAPLWMCIFATGRIKSYQISMAVTYIIELILVYILFKFGASFVLGVSMKAVLNFAVIFIRLYYANKEVESFSCKQYISNVILPIGMSIFVTLLLCSPLLLLHNGGWCKVVITIYSVVVSVCAAFFIGLNKSERLSVVKLVKNKIK